MTGGCLLVAFASDGATGNNDDDINKAFLANLQHRPWKLGSDLSDLGSSKNKYYCKY